MAAAGLGRDAEDLKEHGGVNWLDEVLLEPHFLAPPAGVVRAVGGDGDEAGFLSCRVLTQGDGNTVAVLTWQSDVAQNNFRRPLLGDPDAFQAVVSDLHFITVQVEQLPQTLGRGLVVLYNDNSYSPTRQVAGRHCSGLQGEVWQGKFTGVKVVVNKYG